MSVIKLSPSALNLFQDCPRCFWLEKIKNIKRPRGPFPSLPGGMDRIIKVYFDTFRKSDELPPELKVGDFEGIRLFPDQQKLDAWRSWRTGLVFKDENGASFSGALDDLLQKENRFIPFDYKTKGSPTSVDDAVRYYRLQMDSYALLLEKNDMPPAGYAFLLYFSPTELAEHGATRFHMQAIKIKIDINRALQVFRRAVEVMRGTLPKSSPACEYCAWSQKYGKAVQNKA